MAMNDINPIDTDPEDALREVDAAQENIQGGSEGPKLGLLPPADAGEPDADAEDDSH
jgi:hypothetical protein